MANGGLARGSTMSTSSAYIPSPRRVLLPLYSNVAYLWKRLLQLPVGREAPVTKLICGALRSDVDVVLFCSGTSALTAAVAMLMRPGEPREVLVSTFNCPQVIDAVIAGGGTPVLVDCFNDGSLSPSAMRRAIDENTAGVVLTHQWGTVSTEALEILAIARGRGLWVIDDAAQAFGAYTASGQAAGTLGDVGVLSFGRTKPICASSGGALLVPNGKGLQVPRPDNRRQSDLLARHSVALDLLYTLPRLWRGFLVHLLRPSPSFRDVRLALESSAPHAGSRRRMSRSSLAALRRALAALDGDREVGRQRTMQLAEDLADVPVSLVSANAPGYSASAFVLQVKARDRYALGRHLSDRGVQVGWHHFPLHLVTRYGRYARGEMPNAERLWQRLLIVPCRRLNSQQVRSVSRFIKEFYV